jgi:SagB-type dehydrogenase family enzyme
MDEIKLPDFDYQSGSSLNKLLFERHSCRKFENKKLNLQQISQLLWSALGRNKYKSTAPSAGAIHPLDLYLVSGENSVEEIAGGVYLYDWQRNKLYLHLKGVNLRKNLAYASLNQDFIYEAPVSIIITANYERITSHYGKRGERYVYMEVGHVCQNIYLEAISLGLGTVVIGAFNDKRVKNLLNIKSLPLAVMPIGYPKE